MELDNGINKIYFYHKNKETRPEHIQSIKNTKLKIEE